MAIGFDLNQVDMIVLLFQMARSIPPAIVAEKVPILPAFDAPGGQFSMQVVKHEDQHTPTEHQRERPKLPAG